MQNWYLNCVKPYLFRPKTMFLTTCSLFVVFPRTKYQRLVIHWHTWSLIAFHQLTLFESPKSISPVLNYNGISNICTALGISSLQFAWHSHRFMSVFVCFNVVLCSMQYVVVEVRYLLKQCFKANPVVCIYICLSSHDDSASTALTSNGKPSVQLSTHTTVVSRINS